MNVQCDMRYITSMHFNWNQKKKKHPRLELALGAHLSTDNPDALYTLHRRRLTTLIHYCKDQEGLQHHRADYHSVLFYSHTF